MRHSSNELPVLHDRTPRHALGDPLHVRRCAKSRRFISKMSVSVACKPSSVEGGHLSRPIVTGGSLTKPSENQTTPEIRHIIFLISKPIIAILSVAVKYASCMRYPNITSQLLKETIPAPKHSSVSSVCSHSYRYLKNRGGILLRIYKIHNFPPPISSRCPQPSP